MAVKKIEFTNLSSSLAYTAIGGIRFYDSDGIMIESGNIISDSATSGETDNFKATATSTYTGNSNYYVIHAFDTNRPQTAGYADGSNKMAYWLTGNDNQTLTLEFKIKINSISKIEFIPRPDGAYSNRGVDSDFVINVYDENNNLIKSYNITPITTINTIQTLYTPELNHVNKILILSNNVYKKWDTTISSWVNVTTNPPTETDFLNGINFSILPLIPRSAWYQLGNNFDVLYYTDDPNKTSATLEVTANYSPLDELNDDFEIVTWANEDGDDVERKIDMIALPKGQLIVSVSDIKIYGDLKSIIVNKVSQTGLNDGIIRLLLSFDDGVTWKSHNGIDWIVVDKNNINDVINNGLTLDKLSTLTESDYNSQFIDEYVRIAYYIEEHIRGIDIAQIDSVQFDTKVPTETTEINDMALYILNTKSTINVIFNANHLEGEIIDDDAGRVQYRIILNGKPYYPADGSFTPLQPSPVAINIKLQNDEILIGQNNTLRIEFQDYWGHADYWEAQFVGTYAGLMFSDPNGNYYTTDLGQLLKYLDFGVLIAGQTSLENEIVLTNKYGYPVQNLKVKAINIMKDNGIRLELSKTNTPFIAEEELTFDQVLNHDEMVKFYVRLATDITATPVSSGVLEIRANAQKV